VQLLDNMFREGARERRRAAEEAEEAKDDNAGDCQLFPLKEHPYYTAGKGQTLKGSVCAVLNLCNLTIGGLSANAR
jgi:hypothetical protein